MINELPFHPFTGLRALGVLPSGRPVWPVLGGAPDNGSGGSGAGGGEGGSSGANAGGTGGGGQNAGGQSGGSNGAGSGGGNNTGGSGDNGGEGGKRFDQADVDRIVAERLGREQRKFADYDQLKADAAELAKIREASASDAEKAVGQARKEAEARVRGELEPRMNRLEVALRIGLPEELGAKVLSAAKRLVGTNIAELEADAREFFGTSPIQIGGQAGQQGGQGGAGGGGALDQGVRGRGGNGGSGKPTSMAAGRELYRELRGGRKTT